MQELAIHTTAASSSSSQVDALVQSHPEDADSSSSVSPATDLASEGVSNGKPSTSQSPVAPIDGQLQ